MSAAPSEPPASPPRLLGKGTTVAISPGARASPGDRDRKFSRGDDDPLSNLTPAQNGGSFDYAGEEIVW